MAEGKQSRFDLIINAVERVSGPFRRIEQAMDGVRDRTEKARQALGRFSRVTGLQRLSGSIGNVRDKLQGMVQQGQAGLERLGALAGRLSLLFGAAGGGAWWACPPATGRSTRARPRWRGWRPMNWPA